MVTVNFFNINDADPLDHSSGLPDKQHDATIIDLTPRAILDLTPRAIYQTNIRPGRERG